VNFVKLDFLDEFSDPYLKEDSGKGVFLAGVALGMLAKGQAGQSGDLGNSPLFKQINFGKIQLRDLKKHLSRIPELIRAYEIPYAGMIEVLAAEAGKLIITGQKKDLGVDGNFVFAVAFMNAPKFCFEKIFKKQEEGKE
jgi:hypothetical protein